MPLSYLDNYYALGSGGQDYLDDGLDNGLGTFSPLQTTQNEPHGESPFEEKRELGKFKT